MNKVFNMSTRNRILLCGGVCLLMIGMLLPKLGKPSVTYAQATPIMSWDFEKGVLSDWTPAGQVQVIADSIDPMTDNAMHTVAQGQYSVQIGDTVPWGEGGDQFSSIEQTLTVPQGDGKPVLQFSYAVVANDPAGHVDTDKPYFQLEVRDINTGDLLPVSDFKYTSQTSNEWFLGLPQNGQNFGFSTVSGDRWVFIPWRHEKIDLAARIGHQLLIKFTVRDCNPRAHAAYGYLDNIHIGQTVAPPKLPDLVKQPDPAGAPPIPNPIQSGAAALEVWGAWPWCLFIPLLLLLAALAYFLWPRRVIGDKGYVPPTPQAKKDIKTPNTGERGANWRDPNDPNRPK